VISLRSLRFHLVNPAQLRIYKLPVDTILGVFYFARRLRAVKETNSTKPSGFRK
jgi:hypothetical protein